ncbi:MAG: sugar phosphate isomerase/epimerase [bacterium]|nr:sugar phosphate isomerase/epimerase [bacterium]
MMWEGIYIRATARNFDDIVAIAEELGVGVELQVFALPASYNGDTEPGLKRYSERLRDFGGPVSFHAPYMDLSITSPDKYIRDHSYKLFGFAFETAASLKAGELIVHSGYNPLIAFKKYKDGFAADFVEAISPFIERANNRGIVIYVENIFETTPDIVTDIAKTADSPNLRVCFDVGHANIFSTIELREWVETISSYLGYVHMHDNDGVCDDHLLPGDGSADIEAVIAALTRLKHIPAISLEVTAPGAELKRVISNLRDRETSGLDI